MCSFLLAHLGPEGENVGETYIGIILLILSLVMLCGCLIGKFTFKVFFIICFVLRKFSWIYI